MTNNKDGFRSRIADWITAQLKAVSQKIRVTIRNVVFLVFSALCGYGVLFITGNLIGASCAAISFFLLCKSNTFIKDLVFAGLFGGSLYYAWQNDWGLALTLAVSIMFIGYALSLGIIALGKAGKFWTLGKLNEHRVIETEGGMRIGYIGIAERWVNPTTKEIEKPENRSDASVLMVFRPNFETGKMMNMGMSLNLFPTLTGGALYLAKRLGVLWIGLPGIIKVKKFDLSFKTVEKGKPAQKDYKDIDTIFDSFIYLFEAHNLETQGNLSIFFSAQTRLYVDNLFEVAYGALPMGKWVDYAEGEFQDLAKEHAAIKDYTQLLGEQKEKLTEKEKKEQRQEVANTFYSEMLSEEARRAFISKTGHYPVSLDVYDFGLEKDPATEDILKKGKQNEISQAAELLKQQKQLEIEKEKTKQASEIRKQKTEVGMAEVDVQAAYVKNVIQPIEDNPDALNTLATKHISEMDNLSALNTGSVLIEKSKAKPETK